MAPYQYQPLDQEANHIRLMMLLPGDFSAEVRVELIHKPLLSDRRPKFEALSYTWGLVDNPSHICVGSIGDNTLIVTQNLGEALPHLGYTDRLPFFWIGAVCVNQQDMEERGRQVERMGDIYTLADRVVVWLGPKDSTSAYALRLLDKISSQVVVHWVSGGIEPISRDTID